MSLRVIPVELSVAKKVVAAIHRHHAPPLNHRFSLAVIDDDGLIRGVAVVGRPVSRGCNPRTVLEVARVATDGARNACSMLLGAAARAGKALGYQRIQTYTLPEEGGASLRGAGWIPVATTAGGQWVRADGEERRTDQPTNPKVRWEKELNPEQPTVVLPEVITEEDRQESLFGAA